MMKTRRKSFERYQRRMERAAVGSILCTAALGMLAWTSLLEALAAAMW